MSGRILAGFLVVLLMTLVSSAEPTRVVQAEEILKKIELGQPVEYQNVIVVGDLDLSGLDLPRVPAQRTYMEINRGLQYYDIVVTSPIRIINSIIEGSVNLKGTVFEKVTNFGGTKFEGPVFLTGSRFNDTASFWEVEFNDTCSFLYAQFNNAAYFSSVQFNQYADFYGTQFNQDADFNAAKFNWNADFSWMQFNQTAYFYDAKFNQTAYFSWTQFNQTALFSEALFNQAAIFWFAQFNQAADFERAQFKQTVDFSRTKFNQTTSFDSGKFSHFVGFFDAGFLDVSFDDSQFSKEAFFDNAQINGTLSLYRTKYEILNIRWSSIHDLAYDDTAYHLLIQNFNKLGFGDDASECQYSYRCKHRAELFRQYKFDTWLFDLLAWATYGYGLRPVRPLGWAALLILMGGLFFFLTGSITRSKENKSEKKPLALRRREEPPNGNVSIWEAFLLSATYFTSGASSIISATPTEFVPVGRGRYVVVILRLMGWIFFVLFLSSLTRTV